MSYILFETQANFAELALFAACGGGWGLCYSLLKGWKSAAKSAVIFALLAASVVLCMANINKSHLGYQTIIIPLATFFLTFTLSK